jgi:preprotein translocase subunit SecF
MMKLFKKEPDFKFMNKRFIAFALSGLIIIAGFLTYKTRGFNLGIDFAGGTMVEVSFKSDTDENDLRTKLAKVGLAQSTIQRVGVDENKFFIKTLNITSKETQDQYLEEHEKVAQTLKKILTTQEEDEQLQAGKIDLNNTSQKGISDFIASKGIPAEDSSESALKIGELKKNTTGLIKTFQEIEQLDLKKRVMNLLRENSFLGNFTFLSVEIVGPQVGHDLQKKATLAAIWAMLGMLVYIGFRFRIIFGLAAVITLLHDVLICLSIILFFNVEVSLPVVAALLTIIGYSLNDTIVIFDRVRDNVKLMRRDNAELILDKSINQTLSRTIVTSGTTLITVLSLYFLGGEVIHTFSFTLMVGILVGTYSSIFQSCAWLKIWERFFLKKKK